MPGGQRLGSEWREKHETYIQETTVQVLHKIKCNQSFHEPKKASKGPACDSEGMPSS